MDTGPGLFPLLRGESESGADPAAGEPHFPLSPTPEIRPEQNGESDAHEPPRRPVQFTFYIETGGISLLSRKKLLSTRKHDIKTNEFLLKFNQLGSLDCR